VGEGGDEVSVARFIADQRIFYRVPHTFSCRVLAVSEAWFYKWRDRPPTPRQTRRALLDEAVRKAFAGSRASYGSPRVHADLIDPAVVHPELTAPIANGGEEPLVLVACREPGSDRADEPVEELSASGADPDVLPGRVCGATRDGDARPSVAGVGEHGRGLDAPSRPGRTQGQAQSGPDVSGPDGAEVPGPARA
jgi:hypothetical protein